MQTVGAVEKVIFKMGRVKCRWRRGTERKAEERG